jgi:DNA-directed RNA polymerase specialized sigma24 family protein
LDTDPTPTTPRPARRHHRDEAAQAEAARTAYVVAVSREVQRLASRSHRGFDADDIAQRVVERVLQNTDDVMSRFPDPAEYARKATRNAGQDHLRRERVQRGGDARNNRRQLGWDEVGLHEQDRALGWGLDPAPIAVGQVGAEAIRRVVTDNPHWALFAQMALTGARPVELAADHGVHHGTVSRRISAVRKALESKIDPDGYLRGA